MALNLVSADNTGRSGISKVCSCMYFSWVHMWHLFKILNVTQYLFFSTVWLYVLQRCWIKTYCWYLTLLQVSFSLPFCITQKAKRAWSFLPISTTGSHLDRTDFATVKWIMFCVVGDASWYLSSYHCLSPENLCLEQTKKKKKIQVSFLWEA